MVWVLQSNIKSLSELMQPRGEYWAETWFYLCSPAQAFPEAHNTTYNLTPHLRRYAKRTNISVAKQPRVGGVYFHSYLYYRAYFRKCGC